MRSSRACFGALGALRRGDPRPDAPGGARDRRRATRTSRRRTRAHVMIDHLLPRAPSAAACSASRARDSRLLTVPSGIPRAAATSSQERPSTSRRTRTERWSKLSSSRAFWTAADRSWLRACSYGLASHSPLLAVLGRRPALVQLLLPVAPVTMPEATAVVALVHDDPVDPGLQAAPPLEPVEPAVDLQEHLLGHVPGLLSVAEEPGRQVEDHALVQRHDAARRRRRRRRGSGRRARARGPVRRGRRPRAVSHPRSWRSPTAFPAGPNRPFRSGGPPWDPPRGPSSPTRNIGHRAAGRRSLGRWYSDPLAGRSVPPRLTPAGTGRRRATRVAAVPRAESERQEHEAQDRRPLRDPAGCSTAASAGAANPCAGPHAREPPTSQTDAEAHGQADGGRRATAPDDQRRRATGVGHAEAPAPRTRHRALPRARTARASPGPARRSRPSARRSPASRSRRRGRPRPVRRARAAG